MNANEMSPEVLHDAIARLRALLAELNADDPAAALAVLGQARAELDLALDEAMAASVLAGNSTRQVAADVGLSPNAVPPRLARTHQLGAYADDGRVTAEGIARARYDAERGTAPATPMRFIPRKRTTPKET